MPKITAGCYCQLLAHPGPLLYQMAKKTSNEYKREQHARRALIDHPEPSDVAHRQEIEADDALWLKMFLPDAYPLGFGKVHYEIMERARYAVTSGGRYAIAAPRGEGKTTTVNGLCLKALLTGEVRFPVTIPWKEKDMKRALKFWLTALCWNDIVASKEYGYPDICEPFRRANGISQRLNSLCWRDTGESTGAHLMLSDGMIVLPEAAGVIGSATLNGNPRGLQYTVDDGLVLRPDLALIDDPSDRETARSPERTRQNCETIDADIMGMAGPDSNMPTVMTGTVICEGDTMTHYLGDDAADWDSTKVAQIIRWPENMDLWSEWNKIRVKGLAEKDHGAADRAFYKKHKKKLLEGFEVSWTERYDKKRGEPDAFYAAMKDFYRMGPTAFASERQNAPQLVQSTVFDLNEKDITNNADEERAAGALPGEVRQIVAYSDINLYGIHWAAIGFVNDFTGYCTYYGKFDNKGQGLVPKNAPEQDRKRLVYEALVQHGDMMAKLPLQVEGSEDPAKLSLWLIDGGYMFDVVYRYVHQAHLPFRVLASRGFGSDKYRPNQRVVGAPYEEAHLTETAAEKKQYVAYNKDYWQEIAQRAWLGSIGAPGSLSLWGKGRPDHREFAEHICRERLVEKVEGKTGPIWRFHTRPGRHDLGDAVYGCYVAAAVQGLRTTGEVQVIRRRRPVRKVRR
jgi:hypothetical protein